jgi:hypothetical protein
LLPRRSGFAPSQVSLESSLRLLVPDVERRHLTDFPFPQGLRIAMRMGRSVVDLFGSSSLR